MSHRLRLLLKLTDSKQYSAVEFTCLREKRFWTDNCRLRIGAQESVEYSFNALIMNHKAKAVTQS